MGGSHLARDRRRSRGHGRADIGRPRRRRLSGRDAPRSRGSDDSSTGSHPPSPGAGFVRFAHLRGSERSGSAGVARDHGDECGGGLAGLADGSGHKRERSPPLISEGPAFESPLGHHDAHRLPTGTEPRWRVGGDKRLLSASGRRRAAGFRGHSGGVFAHDARPPDRGRLRRVACAPPWSREDLDGGGDGGFRGEGSAGDRRRCCGRHDAHGGRHRPRVPRPHARASVSARSRVPVARHRVRRDGSGDRDPSAARTLARMAGCPLPRRSLLARARRSRSRPRPPLERPVVAARDRGARVRRRDPARAQRPPRDAGRGSRLNGSSTASVS